MNQYVGVAQTETPQHAVWMTSDEMEAICQLLGINFFRYCSEAIALTQVHRETITTLSAKLCMIAEGLQNSDELLFVPVRILQDQPNHSDTPATVQNGKEVDPERIGSH